MTPKWAHKYERKPGRWVFEPTTEYRAIGEEIKKAVRKVWRAPRYYFHLRSGGHVLALERHTMNAHFVRFDIEDFFGRVSRNRVARCLKEYFGVEEARKMAEDSTVRHPTEKGRWTIPYGFVQSPILASLALAKSRLGTVLDGINRSKALKVSVYVDDIIVSSNDAAMLPQACEALAQAAAKAGFGFNSAKSQGPAETITAFNIELTHSNLTIVEARLIEFSLDLATADPLKRKGILGYVRSVNADQADELAG